MNTKTKPTKTPGAGGTPRPILTLVKALGLDAVSLPGGKTRQKKPRAAANDAPIVSIDGRIPESGRNNMLTSLAGSMRRRGMGDAAIEGMLQLANIDHCDPPLDKTEVSAIAASIMRYPSADSAELLRTLTDVGNAARFGKAYTGKTIFNPGMGWFIWDGLRWRPDDSGTVMEMAKEVAAAIYHEGESLKDGEDRMKVAQHGHASQRLPRLTAMIDLAKSLPELAVSASDLDSDDMLLGVANGVINLRTGKLRAPDPADRITRHSPVAYDKNAICPLFDKFMAQITCADKALVCYLRRVVGYCLTGRTGEQCLFFLYGSGANGKSTFLIALKETLGPDLAKQASSETFMARTSTASNDLARLMGVRIVLANEIEDGSPLSESLVKQLTGGDTIPARYLYKEHFEFTPKFKLMFAGNHKPTIRGRDEGIWRRIRLIPFTTTIAPADRDKHLQEKLRGELPGILNWAIKGCLEWQKMGLAEPQVVTDASAAYRQEMDLLSAWIADKCDVGPTLQWKSRMAYANYSMWAVGGGYRPMSESVFSRELESSFKKVRRKDGNYFLGIGAKTL